MEGCKLLLTAIEKRLKLVKDEIDELVDATNIRRMVGSLRYLTSTKPEIANGATVNDVSGIFSWSSKKEHAVALSTKEVEYVVAANSAISSA
ncbi:hypothetical protein JRO89_XS04G0114700 [Xanthoceras sorbifolium]|uniref:Uncharacterized protein n=1 Tax=Xanthoceras sorbifolium TaxID=99658 RepID=A0ABQ8I4V2_9ROSI|nr:hypothetical protein JRO89_XS04G0114700 [Xanthoceras sorbifolium]